MNIFVNNIWDIKSKRYPLPFDDVTYKKTIEIIDIAIKNGVKISDSHILDIGCGTGIFTLPLARMASKIIGLDNSKAMLERLKDEAQKWSISNVSTFLKAWNDVDIETLCWKKSFHVVWASMTPAIKNDKDILKMEQCAKDWCVFIGWAKKRENDFYSEGFKLFDSEYKSPENGIKITKILDDLNRVYYAQDFFDSWSWQGTVDEAIEDLLVHLKMIEIHSNRESIENFVYKRSHDGVIRHTTYAEKRIILWRCN